MDHHATWQKWDSTVHSSENSKKRISSAQKPALTPLRLEKEDGYAYFQGTNGRYETFLDHCPCTDFLRRKLPCKHIYRLAMELDLIEGSPKSDLTKVKVPKTKGIALVPALDIIETCSESTQLLAYELFKEIHLGTHQMTVNIGEDISVLLEKNIFCECVNDSLKEKYLKTKELVKLLKEKGLDVGIRKTPHDELIRLAYIYIPEYINEIYSKIVVVCIDDTFSKVRIKLQKYLKRKFDPELTYNENMEVVAVYPDDEITALLISRGFLQITDD